MIKLSLRDANILLCTSDWLKKQRVLDLSRWPQLLKQSAWVLLLIKKQRDSDLRRRLPPKQRV